MSSDNITQTKEIKEIKEKITYNFHKKRDDDIMNIISKDDGGVTIEITDDDDKKLNINVSQKIKISLYHLQNVLNMEYSVSSHLQC